MARWTPRAFIGSNKAFAAARKAALPTLSDRKSGVGSMPKPPPVSRMLPPPFFSMASAAGPMAASAPVTLAWMSEISDGTVSSCSRRASRLPPAS